MIQVLHFCDCLQNLNYIQCLTSVLRLTLELEVKGANSNNDQGVNFCNECVSHAWNSFLENALTV